jgi:hypothetical protein
MSSENVGKGIAKKYSREIGEIAYKLHQLEIGNIYEKTGSRMDGYLATNIQQIRKQLVELLSKIENDTPSINNEIRAALNIYRDDK